MTSARGSPFLDDYTERHKRLLYFALFALSSSDFRRPVPGLSCVFPPSKVPIYRGRCVLLRRKALFPCSGAASLEYVSKRYGNCARYIESEFSRVSWDDTDVGVMKEG